MSIKIDDLDAFIEAIANRMVEKLAERASRKYLSRDEFAKVHGLGKRTVDRAIAEGRLAVERSGRRVLIPADAKIQNGTVYREKALADDAVNRAVQKTHPKNQNLQRYCECGNKLEDYEQKFCVACGL